MTPTTRFARRSRGRYGFRWVCGGCRWAWACFWFSLALAAAGAVLGFEYPLAFIAVGFVFAAIWYFAAIRWVDQNGQWP